MKIELVTASVTRKLPRHFNWSRSYH